MLGQPGDKRRRARMKEEQEIREFARGCVCLGIGVEGGVVSCGGARLKESVSE
jgi:hypothetical protein